MIEVTQEDREAAASALDMQPNSMTWDRLTAAHRTPTQIWQANRVAQAFATHRQAAFNAGRASAVQWLRDDAKMTEIEARRILGNLVKLTPAATDDWAKLILMKHGIADALERLP